MPIHPDLSTTLSSGHGELRRVQWLRDFAIAGVALLVLMARPVFSAQVPLLISFSLLALWTLISLITWLRLRRPTTVSAQELFWHLVVDLVLLTWLLAISGGHTNPLTALYLPTVAIAAAILPRHLAWSVGISSVLAYTLLWKLNQPLVIEDVHRATQMHLVGMWLTFAAAALLISGFISHTTQTLRAREQQLAAAREQNLRDERIVALGNLAAGAAHELGTPLATMAVIAGDLEHAPELPSELVAEISLLNRQIAACKNIISRLAERAGKPRAPEGLCLPATTWLEQLVERWRNLRPQTQAQLHVKAAGTCSATSPPSVQNDINLEQALLNLFNNAADASPESVEIRLDWSAQELIIDILDRGPGMNSEQLARAGRDFFPRHADGSGIGLFLTHAALERQGGRLQIQTRDGGGSQIRVYLPFTHGIS